MVRLKGLIVVVAVGGCGASRASGECVPLPEPDIQVRCGTDADCTASPPLPASCGEGKCIAGICRFRAEFAEKCPCMPGEIRTCLLPSKDTGLARCISIGGIPNWGPCEAVCLDC